jgi:hypothetical protein
MTGVGRNGGSSSPEPSGTSITPEKSAALAIAAPGVRVEGALCGDEGVDHSLTTPRDVVSGSVLGNRLRVRASSR